MTSEQVTHGKRFRDSLKSSKVKLAGFAAAGMGLVASASAAVDLNTTIGPIMDSMIELIPTIIALVVALVPAIIIMAVVGFVVSFFDNILRMLKL